MKKEEILEASRKENKNRDIYEKEVENKAGTNALVAMIVLTFIYFTYEIMSGKGTNYALYSLLTLYNTVFYGGKAIKLETRRKLNAFTAIIWGLLTVTLILGYFNII